MTWGYLNHLLLLVSLTLIHPSEEDCTDYFKIEEWLSWFTPPGPPKPFTPDPVALIRTNNSMDVLECSLERMCLKHQNECSSLKKVCTEKHQNACSSLENMCTAKPQSDCPSLERMCTEKRQNECSSLKEICTEKHQNACSSLERKCTERYPKVCYIIDCFDRPIVSQISEKCKGETYTRIQMLHFMCWVAIAADLEETPKYCDDYGSLCHTYSEMSFPPSTDQTTLPPTIATTTPPESTTITTTATLPLTTTTTPESTTTTTTTTLQTATTKTAAKFAPIPTDSNSGSAYGMKDSKAETISLQSVLAFSLIMNVAGPLLVYLYMRRQRGRLMMPQNGLNVASFQADAESQSNINLANTSGHEESFLMQQPSSSSRA